MGASKLWSLLTGGRNSEMVVRSGLIKIKTELTTNVTVYNSCGFVLLLFKYIDESGYTYTYTYLFTQVMITIDMYAFKKCGQYTKKCWDYNLK